MSYSMKKRERRGSIDFEFPETKIILDEKRSTSRNKKRR